MVKVILIVMLGYSHLFATDIYEKKCVACHTTLNKSLQQMFMNYILVYGGEENMKAGLKHYLKFPSKEISVMSKDFIGKHGVKTATSLNETEIDNAINIYWDTYKIFGKLN